jgi:hypothetical protein
MLYQVIDSCGNWTEKSELAQAKLLGYLVSDWKDDVRSPIGIRIGRVPKLKSIGRSRIALVIALLISRMSVG